MPARVRLSDYRNLQQAFGVLVLSIERGVPIEQLRKLISEKGLEEARAWEREAFERGRTQGYKECFKLLTTNGKPRQPPVEDHTPDQSASNPPS